MAISETARSNHDRLFPDHVSTLAVTDPELIEVFDNFAFDEVLRSDSLPAQNRGGRARRPEQTLRGADTVDRMYAAAAADAGAFPASC